VWSAIDSVAADCEVFFRDREKRAMVFHELPQTAPFSFRLDIFDG